MLRTTRYTMAAALAAALGTGALAGCAGASVPVTGTTSLPTTGTTSFPTTGITDSASPGGISTGSTAAPGSNTSGSTSGPTLAGTPQCVTSNLVAAVNVVAGSQGMGHEALNITLTNISGHPCTVYGFPGLQLRIQDMEGQPGLDQTTTTTWTTGAPKSLVTLADSGSASTTVIFDVDVPGPGEPQSGACEPDSYYLGIIPPNNTTALTARIGGANATTGITVCEHGNLEALPFIAGSTGPNQ
jgi:hypothetical protein